MTSKIVIGNLKMHSVAALLSEYQALSEESFGLLVPYPYLQSASQLFENSGIWVGAQGISSYVEGAYTAQVSAKMLVELGIQTVMIGHSEVRTWDTEVSEKLQRASESQLQVIYCIGERASEDRETTLIAQLEALQTVENIIIAYEPVWSIGTGQLPSYQEIQSAVMMIRQWVSANRAGNMGSVKVLYGGSIDNKNCEGVLSHTDVDGFLVGGAALKPKTLLEVVKRCK